MLYHRIITPHASGNSSGAAKGGASSSPGAVASAFWPGARAALCALRMWWQHGTRASTDRTPRAPKEKTKNTEP